MTTATATEIVLSNDGSIRYSTGNPEQECHICREEWTSIVDLDSDIPICLYCAHARREPYQPSRELTD